MLIAVQSIAWLTRIFAGMLAIGIELVGHLDTTKTNVFCSKNILQTSMCKREFEQVSTALHFKNFLHCFC